MPELKIRVRIDTFILLGVIFSGFLFCIYFRAFTNNIFLDDFLDLLGFLAIFKGVYLRMAARGFKKANSNMGRGLVISGPYTLTRNPMYLGSFLLGCGFVLTVWPWWFLPIFAYAFYLRFNRQMVKEEKHLMNLFGKDYEGYAEKTPRIFPRIKDALYADVKQVFPLQYMWSTKEKFGLVGWPLLAVVLDYSFESMVFGEGDLIKTISLFSLAASAFALTMVVEYNRG